MIWTVERQTWGPWRLAGAGVAIEAVRLFRRYASRLRTGGVRLLAPDGHVARAEWRTESR